MLIAEVDHKRWKNLIFKYLDSSNSAASPPPLDEHACRFGRWYYSHESRRYARIEAFKLLGVIHSRLHEVGRELLEQPSALEAERQAPLRQELEGLSNQLSDCIRQIQAEILLAS
jgi:hypothetical protein